MDIKLIAIDMDGTLLGPDHQISKENAAAIRRAQEKGITIVICSGRMVQDIRVPMEQAGLGGYWAASCNGTYTLSPDQEVLDKVTFPPQVALQIEEKALRHPLMVSAFLVDRVAYQMGGDMPNAQALEQQLVLDHHVNVVRGPAEMKRARADGVLKYVVFDRVPNDALSVLEVELAGTEGVTVTSSWIHNLELIPTGIDKGVAVRHIAEHLGIGQAHVMTLGDQLNDLPMLTWAGVGVAMGNALREVKAQCTHVTTPCEQHGVAAAIRKYALGVEA